MRIPLAGCLAVSFSMTGAALRAQAPANDRIREGETKQQELQVQAQSLIAEWSAMIADYERNGIAGDDVKPVKNLLALLSKLSDSDMKKVVDLLQQARSTKDPKAALRAVEAYGSRGPRRAPEEGAPVSLPAVAWADADSAPSANSKLCAWVSDNTI